MDGRLTALLNFKCIHRLPSPKGFPFHETHTLFLSLIAENVKIKFIFIEMSKLHNGTLISLT